MQVVVRYQSEDGALWDCEPMYSPNQINLGGKVHFWGIGGWLSVADIVRYWAHTQEASK